MGDSLSYIIFSCPYLTWGNIEHLYPCRSCLVLILISTLMTAFKVMKGERGGGKVHE